MSIRNALAGGQTANDVPGSGELDDAMRAKLAQGGAVLATRLVRIPERRGQVAHAPQPDDPAERAKLARLGHATLAGRLAEGFHTDGATPTALDPGGHPAGGKGVAEAPSAPATCAASPSPSTAPDGAGPALLHSGQLVRVPDIGGDRIVPGAFADAAWQRPAAARPHRDAQFGRHAKRP